MNISWNFFVGKVEYSYGKNIGLVFLVFNKEIMGNLYLVFMLFKYFKIVLSFRYFLLSDSIIESKFVFIRFIFWNDKCLILN